jgi:hypothetical protein
MIRSRIDHRNLRGIDSHMAKHNQYAAWEAQRLFSHLHHPWGGLAFFLGSFLQMGGWRVGSVCFAFCTLRGAWKPVWRCEAICQCKTPSSGSLNAC